MRMLAMVTLVLAVSVATGCGDDDGGGDCGPSPCGLCAPGCTNVDRCVGGEWQCDCECSSDAAMVDAPATCVSGGTSGCGTDAPCCSPYSCSAGYCCGGEPPDPHWDCL